MAHIAVSTKVIVSICSVLYSSYSKSNCIELERVVKNASHSFSACFVMGAVRLG